MKIMLILAAAPHDPLRKADPFMPLSLPLIAASAPDHDYVFVDMLSGEKPKFNGSVDLVGISARITAERVAFEMADKFRSRGVKVVLGGAQVSSNPHMASEHADTVVIGEGEGVWPQLLDDLERGQLKDFYVGSGNQFDAGDKQVHQSDRFLELGTLGDSVESRKFYKKKYVFDTVFATRGCPLNCDFCSVSHIFGKKVRQRPIEDVVRDISSFKGFYFLMDDTVFGWPSTYTYYSDLYDAIASQEKVNLWYGQANLDAASTPEGREIIKKAAKAGLFLTAIGMESINPLVMQKAGTISKNGTRDPKRVLSKMRDSIRFIQDQGIVISGWFTLGYEEDTVDTIYDTLEFCHENNVVPVLSPLEALPGTPLFKRLSLEGRVDYNKKINVVHPTMSDEDILDSLAKCNKEGFSFKNILRRTGFYKTRFKESPYAHSATRKDIIQKTIFVYIWQTKIKNGIAGLANSGAVSPVSDSQ